MGSSVAKFTVAATPSTVLSFFSTRAAHAAQGIPWTDKLHLLEMTPHQSLPSMTPQ